MLPFPELMTACESDTASLESGKRLVLTWINYSHAEVLPRETEQYNDTQVFGFGLAYMLSKYDSLQIRSRPWADLPEAFSMHGHGVAQYSCKQCLEFLRMMQVEYGTVLHFDQTVGYEADVDMTLLLLVMRRKGLGKTEGLRLLLSQRNSRPLLLLKLSSPHTA